VPDGDTTTEPDRLTVVIAAYNGEQTIGRLVSAALASRAVDKVLVIDNASSDGSAKVAGGLGAEVILLSENGGFGAACNEGLARCTTRWVAFCNQDIEPVGDLFGKLLDAALTLRAPTNPEVIVAPKLQSAADEIAETGHRLPSWRRQLLELLFGASAAALRNVVADTASEPVRVDWVSAACIVGPVAALRSLGGFDPSYFMYVEDVDLFQRWQSRGLAAFWVPSALAVHTGGRRPISGRLYARSLSNWVRYFARTDGVAAAALIALAGIAGAGARGAFWALRLGRDPDAGAYARMFLGGAVGAVRLEAAMLRDRLVRARRLKSQAPGAGRPSGKPG
jgi:N-acetylglucosaminyl-diphospho-decaprenol L-rhamnosyltransferase